MKIFLLCPLHPLLGICNETRRSIEELDTTGFDVVVHYDNTETQTGDIDRNQSILDKFQNGRSLFLAGDYDAMLTVEYDNIVPADALQRLAKVAADIAYGLYCGRQNHQWLAFWRLFDNSGITYSKDAPTVQSAWGNIIETCGVGFGCTLIRRHVLEAIPFRIVPGHPCANDWHFALDCINAGFVQKHDCAVIVGHIVSRTPLSIVWPALEYPFHRIETVEQRGGTLETPAGIETYICLDNIYHPHHGHYYCAGDEITLDDTVAKLMLDLGKVIRKAPLPAAVETNQSKRSTKTVVIGEN